jgi:hypothetical protein
MTQPDRGAARALFLAALNAFGITFSADDVERLAVEFEEYVQDGRLLAAASPPEAEPLPSARTGW